MFGIILALLLVCGLLALVFAFHMFFVFVMFLVDKFLNKGKLKFREYIKYW